MKKKIPNPYVCSVCGHIAKSLQGLMRHRLANGHLKKK